MLDNAKYPPENLPMAAATQDFVVRLFKERPTPNHLYHSYQHTCEVVALCQRIADNMRLTAADKDTLLTAAWLHDVGYLYTYEQHEAKSIEIGEQFLTKYGATVAVRQVVAACINATRMNVAPVQLLEEILHDADLGYSLDGDFELLGNLLRMEWQLVLGKQYTNGQWDVEQLKFLSETVSFYTPYAKIHFAPRAAEYLARYAKRVAKKAEAKKEKQNLKAEKLEKQAERTTLAAALHPYDRLEPKTPVRAVQSFFRSVYPNHLELSSIADNKANMMISINSIVLTLIIALYSVGIGKAGELKSSLDLLPIALFVCTALASLCIAVLSVMPKVTNLNRSKDISREQIKQNIIFFGNFVHLSPQEYEQIMQEVLNDSQLLYGNMTRDLYYLGKVLHRKYRLLSLSYTVFFCGLTISVVSFLITAFL